MPQFDNDTHDASPSSSFVQPLASHSLDNEKTGVRDSSITEPPMCGGGGGKLSLQPALFEMEKQTSTADIARDDSGFQGGTTLTAVVPTGPEARRALSNSTSHPASALKVICEPAQQGNSSPPTTSANLGDNRCARVAAKNLFEDGPRDIYHTETDLGAFFQDLDSRGTFSTADWAQILQVDVSLTGAAIEALPTEPAYSSQHQVQAMSECSIDAEKRSRLTDFDFDDGFDSPSYRKTSDANGKHDSLNDGVVPRHSLEEDLDSDTTFEIGSDGSLNRSTTNEENGLDSNVSKAFHEVLRRVPSSQDTPAPDADLVVSNEPLIAQIPRRQKQKEKRTTGSPNSPIRRARRSKRPQNKSPKYAQYTRVDLLSRWSELESHIDHQQMEFELYKSKIQGALETMDHHIKSFKAEAQEGLKVYQRQSQVSQEQMSEFKSYLELMWFN